VNGLKMLEILNYTNTSMMFPHVINASMKHFEPTQAGLEVTLQICIREVFGWNFGQKTDYPTEMFRVLPQSVQANTGIVPPSGHDHFLKNSFQFIVIHLSPYHPTL
jgi:hypothetical protein